jgi:hypothetical protein
MGLLAISAFAGLIPALSFLTQETFKLRLGYWEVSSKIILDKPVFGVGLDALGDHYSSYRSRAETLSNLSAVDNAHNVLFQIAATSGLIVAVFLLVIFLYVSFSALRVVLASKAFSSSSTVSILWLMYVSQSLISVEQAGISVWGWFLGGATVSASRSLVAPSSVEDLGFRSKTSKSIKSLTSSKGSSNFRELESLISKVLLLVSLTIAFWFNGKTIDFNELRMRANYIEDFGNDTIPEGDIKRVRNFFRFDPTYSRLVALVALGSRNEQFGFSILRDSSDKFPNNYELVKLNSLALEISKRAKDATPLRRKLTELEPYKSDSWLGLASNYQLLGRRSDAITTLEKAMPLVYDPEVLKARLLSLNSPFVVNDIVFHTFYGAGKVVESSESNLIVKFNNDFVGEKSFDPRTAPLTLARFVSPSIG